MNWNPFPSDVIHALDLWAWGVLMLIIFHVLPPVTIMLSFAYTLLRLYETDTIQRMLGRKRRNDEGDKLR